MFRRILQSIKGLDLEERILNGAACIGILGIFMPWISGEWLGTEDASSYSGFGFFTSVLGFAAFLLLAFTIAIVLVPALGGPVFIRKRHRDLVRMILCSQAAVLVLASLSVLTRVTFEFSRMQIRFGIYITLIGCAVAAFYAFLRFQEFRREQAQGFFRHPEDHAAPPEKKEAIVPPPPPPPPPAPCPTKLFPTPPPGP
jgi:hypothetical protein